MTNIAEWYAADVGAGRQGDSVGAVGFAGKARPLAMALLRLCVGDNGSSAEIVSIMATMAVGKAYRAGIRLPHVEAEDMARSVLAWHRDGVCRACGGLGFQKIDGTPALSQRTCHSCHGTRKVPFEREFKPARVELARWLVVEVEREQAVACKEAARKLRLHIDH